MTTESWLTITGILVTLALAGSGGVFGVMGWFISGMLQERDKKISELKDCLDQFERDFQNHKNRTGREIAIIETVLSDRGFMNPKPLRFPSPPPHNLEGTSE